nr:uncharacterized protein LOC117368118 isoform X1 [Geotrypetes seraphini]
MGGAGVFDPASAWGRGMGRGGGPADWWALGGVGGAGGPFGVPPSGAVQLSGPCFGLSSQVFAGSSVGREAAATSFQEQVQRSGGVQTEEPGRRGLGRVVAADGAAGGGISAMSGQRGPYMVAAADGAAGGSSGPIIAGGAQDMVSSVGARRAASGVADARSFMEPGREGLWDLLRQSVAPTTWTRYNAGFRRLFAFLSSRDWSPGHVSETLLAEFVLDSHRAGFSRGVVAGHLAGFTFFSRALGWRCPSSGFLVRRLLTAMARIAPRQPDARQPISHDLLTRLIVELPAVARSRYEVLLFTAAFSLAFFGAFRVGELLVHPADTVGARGLLLRHVQCGDSTVSLYLARSKTDQLGRGRTVVLNKINGVTCPVTALCAYMAVRPPLGLALLLHVDGGPLTRYQFLAVLRLVLRRCGEDPAHFGTHSFRIGAATCAFLAGVPGEGIRRLGRWSSDCYRSYIRPHGIARGLDQGGI